MSTQSKQRTLFKGGIVATMDKQTPNLPQGDVLVEGERIAAVGTDIQADGAAIVDATDCIVMPGLIDAHHHAWLGVMRRLMSTISSPISTSSRRRWAFIIALSTCMSARN
jgi:5-methylthioadenosine/S-adenosylhomocysteine deaminase